MSHNDLLHQNERFYIQEYINGIKDGTYKKVEIPKNDENTSSSKSRDILDDYKEIRWSNDMPLYEDFIAYGGWNHTCSNPYE